MRDSAQAEKMQCLAWYAKPQSVYAPAMVGGDMSDPQESAPKPERDPAGLKPSSSRKLTIEPSDAAAEHRPQRRRIEIEGGGVIEAGALAGSPLPLAIPEPTATGQLVLPSTTELELILAKAETCEDIACAERMVAACAVVTTSKPYSQDLLLTCVSSHSWYIKRFLSF